MDLWHKSSDAGVARIFCPIAQWPVRLYLEVGADQQKILCYWKKRLKFLHKQ